jgi:hypothetical protein
MRSGWFDLQSLIKLLNRFAIFARTDVKICELLVCLFGTTGIGLQFDRPAEIFLRRFRVVERGGDRTSV